VPLLLVYGINYQLNFIKSTNIRQFGKWWRSWSMRAVSYDKHSLVQCLRSTRNTRHVCVIAFIETSFVIHWAIGIDINNRQRWCSPLLWTLHSLTDNTVVSAHHSAWTSIFFIFDWNEWNHTLRCGSLVGGIRLQNHRGLFHGSKSDLSYHRSRYHR